MSDVRHEARPSLDDLVRRHLAFGWWSLLFFLTLGIGLEALHGLKVSWYLNVGDETRRLLWRLAHAHGTFLGLVHLAFAATVRERGGTIFPWHRLASRCLLGASVALPAGFFLGGVNLYGGDPGAGIALLPLGAALLWVGVCCTALQRPRGELVSKPEKKTRRR